jgi:hypothetical protein
MSESAKKWLVWCSLSLLSLSIIGLLYGIINQIIIFLSLSTLVAVSSAIILIVLYSIKYQDRKVFRKIAELSYYLFISDIILLFLLGALINLFDNFHSAFFLIDAILLSVFTISVLPALIHIFIFKDPEKIFDIVLLLFFLSLSILFKKLHFINANFNLIAMIISTGIGIFMYGVRSLLIIEKNKYLRIFSFIGCSLIMAGSLGLLFKMLWWIGGDILANIYNIPSIAITLIVLLSLPVSGYVLWNSLHKKILKKILIPWTFFLSIFLLRLVFPEAFMLLFSNRIVEQERYEIPGLHLNDYVLKDKNGLEPR